MKPDKMSSIGGRRKYGFTRNSSSRRRYRNHWLRRWRHARSSHGVSNVRPGRYCRLLLLQPPLRESARLETEGCERESVIRIYDPVIRAFKWALIASVKAYRLGISPMLAPSCRHLPTCSEYFIEAVEQHGPFKGGYYGLKRVVRCNPWGTSGFDPVPPNVRVPATRR